jgi:hypothetical protein
MTQKPNKDNGLQIQAYRTLTPNTLNKENKLVIVFAEPNLTGYKTLSNAVPLALTDSALPYRQLPGKTSRK